MSNKTPNSLEPVKKVNVVRMSRWPMYAVLLVGLLLLCVLVYSVNFAHNQEEEQAATPTLKKRNGLCLWAKAVASPWLRLRALRLLPRRNRKRQEARSESR